MVFDQFTGERMASDEWNRVEIGVIVPISEDLKSVFLFDRTDEESGSDKSFKAVVSGAGPFGDEIFKNKPDEAAAKEYKHTLRVDGNPQRFRKDGRIGIWYVIVPDGERKSLSPNKDKIGSWEEIDGMQELGEFYRGQDQYIREVAQFLRSQ